MVVFLELRSLRVRWETEIAAFEVEVFPRLRAGPV
jgi:hypothetical protein